MFGGVSCFEIGLQTFIVVFEPQVVQMALGVTRRVLGQAPGNRNLVSTFRPRNKVTRQQERTANQEYGSRVPELGSLFNYAQ